MELLETPLKDNADIGIGGASDGSNIFKGWVDEIRYYSEPLNQEDATIAFGEGFGDLGANPKIDVPLVNAEANSTVFVSFVKNNGQLSTVSGFTINDLEVTGGQVSGFYEHNATHYRFYVVADKKPQRIKIPYTCRLRQG